MKKGGKLIVFSAPSGSGKTTLIKHLLQQPELNLAFSVSATSRPSRGKEKHGVHYYFMSVSQFQDHIKAGDFLEWEEVYQDTFYGTLKQEVERLWAKGKHVIFDIDVAGGLRIKKEFPEKTLAVFVAPPSIEELKKRLKKRNTESDDKNDGRQTKCVFSSSASRIIIIQRWRRRRRRRRRRSFFCIATVFSFLRRRFRRRRRMMMLLSSS